MLLLQQADKVQTTYKVNTNGNNNMSSAGDINMKNTRAVATFQALSLIGRDNSQQRALGGVAETMFAVEALHSRAAHMPLPSLWFGQIEGLLLFDGNRAQGRPILKPNKTGQIVARYRATES